MHRSAHKIILWSSFIISGFGLLSELVGFVRGDFATVLGSWIGLIYFLKSVHLSVLTIHFQSYYNPDNNLSVNFFTLAFHIMFLVGGLLFMRYGEKETRLLRFSFAVLLIANLLAIANTIHFYLADTNYNHPFSIFFQVVGPLRVGALVAISYWVLKQLNATRSVSLVNDEQGNPDYVDANRWLRFFHLVTDLILCVLIFSSFIHIFGISWLQRLANATEDRFAVFVILIIWRLIYYSFFEGLLGATPAKMLTETRVVRSLTRPLEFSEVFSRTLSRFVPFEPFSFFGKKGWHDDWTLTRVVEETRTGMPGGRYFLFIPAFIGAGFIGYFGHEAYDRYRSYQYDRNHYESKIAAIQVELGQLSDQTLLELEDHSQRYSSNAVYLRILNVSPDSVRVAVLAVESSQYNWLTLYDAFLTQDGYLPEIVIPRSALEQLYLADYDQYSKYPRNETVTRELENAKEFRQSLIHGKRYLIKQVNRVDAPYILKQGGGSIYGSTISLDFENCGWAGLVTEIKSLEGGVEWKPAPFPLQEIGRERYSRCAYVSFSGTGYKQNTSYKFQFTVRDGQNRHQRFEVSGFGLNFVMRRIE